MKIIAIAFALLLVGLVGVSALPSQQGSQLESALRSGEPRIVTDTIVSLIELAAQTIVDAGFDPLNFEGIELDYDAPVPTVFNARAHVRSVNSRGLSNIVVNQMNYALLTTRLTFNVELPGIAASVGNSAWDVNILSGNLRGAFSGSIAVRNIVVTGNVRLNVGIISGVSIREMALTFAVGSIQSNLNLRIQDVDISAPLNNFLSESIPNALKSYEDDINELLTIVVRDIADSILA